MKRKQSQNPEKSPKRLMRLFKPIAFPNIDGKKLLEIDFSTYAGGHPPDIIVTNNEVEFEAHRRILSACCSVSPSVLNKETLTLNTVSSDILKYVYKLVYSRPSESGRSVWELLNWIESRQDFDIDLLAFISKYGCKIAREVFVMYRTDYFTRDIDAFSVRYDLAKKLKLDDIAEAMWKLQIEKGPEIDSDEFVKFRSDMVLEMIKSHDFDDDFSFFQKITKHCKRHSDRRVINAMKSIKSKSSGKDNQIRFEKMKFQVLANELIKKSVI